MCFAVGDWVTIVECGLRTEGFLVSESTIDGWYEVFVVKTSRKDLLYRNLFFKRDKVLKASEYVPYEGNILNLIDIALDERNEEAFNTLTNILRCYRRDPKLSANLENYRCHLMGEMKFD